MTTDPQTMTQQEADEYRRSLPVPRIVGEELLCHDESCNGLVVEWDTGIRHNWATVRPLHHDPTKFVVTWTPSDSGDWEHDFYACRACVTEHRLPDAIIDEDWN